MKDTGWSRTKVQEGDRRTGVRIRTVQTWLRPGGELRSWPRTWRGEMNMGKKEARNRRQRVENAKRWSPVESKGVSEQGEAISGSEDSGRLLSEDFHLWGLWASHFLYVPWGPPVLNLSPGAALCLGLPPPLDRQPQEVRTCVLFITVHLLPGTAWGLGMHCKRRCRRIIPSSLCPGPQLLAFCSLSYALR